MPVLSTGYSQTSRLVFPITGRSILIGRVNSDIVVDDPEVSSNHARILRQGDSWLLEDLGSRNGTYVNDELIDHPVKLSPGDRIVVGSTILVFEDDRADGGRSCTRSLNIHDLYDGRTRLIGRSPDCDIQVDEAIVSGHHTRLEYENGCIQVIDLNSKNGTFVNGEAVSRKALNSGDRIRIGASEFVLQEDVIETSARKNAIRLDVQGVSYVVNHAGQMRTLLDGVEFSVKAGEFVAVLGGSGTGKTSLFRILTGLESPSIGSVMVNGIDYHTHHRQFAGRVGFVPQDDIVHSELTVRSALMYAARLRLPPDMSICECSQNVAKAVGDVNLTHRIDSDIKLLSGGERKRVNVAMELLTEPDIIYLDEPTSGLDPYRERQVMELMRTIADQGRTILLTTHSTLSLDLCDMLLVMGSGGRVVFFGPPREALKHFRCLEYQDIYALIGDTPEEAAVCRHEYWKSRQYREYGQIKELQQQAAHIDSSKNTFVHLSVMDWLHQFWLLSCRYISVLVRDRLNLGILLAQAPFLALIILMVFPADSFKAVVSQDGTSPLRYANLVTFLLAMIAIWFGVSNSVREIVKEEPITTRERLAFLKMSAYLASKFIVLAGLSTVQCTILIIAVGARMGWFDIHTKDVWMLGGVLLLTSLAGLSLGLAISSLARSSDQAISLTPLILVPQIVFSGLFLPDNSSALVNGMAELHISHWAYGALGKIIDINAKIADLPIRIIMRNKCFDGSLESKLIPLTAIFILTISIAFAAIHIKRSR